MNCLKFPIGNGAPETVNVIVEVPYGCTNKYEYDKALDCFRPDRPLFASVHYPGEYGFIPGTLSVINVSANMRRNPQGQAIGKLSRSAAVVRPKAYPQLVCRLCASSSL